MLMEQRENKIGSVHYQGERFVSKSVNHSVEDLSKHARSITLNQSDIHKSVEEYKKLIQKMRAEKEELRQKREKIEQ